MRESIIMEDQDELITRKSDSEDVALEANNSQGYLGGCRMQRRLVYRQSRGHNISISYYLLTQ